MKLSCHLLTIVFLFLVSFAGAQKIIYSEPDKDDNRRMTFEVIGKVSDNFLIYKNVRARHFITVYDNDMNQVGKSEQDDIPVDRLINIDFFPYTDHVWMIFEYQKKNVVYCSAVKVDGMGKKMGEVVEIDTSHIGFAGNNKIYSAVSSEDKNQIMVFKVNSRNKSRYLLTTFLLDREMTVRKSTRLAIPMEDRYDYLGEFNLDNDGDFVFTKFSRTNNDNISKAWMFWKPAMGDSFLVTDLGLDKNFLDELHIKVDNPNKRYFLTSFFYKQKKGNIEGFYFYVWDKTIHKPVMENTLSFTDELRKEARGSANTKMAFNDYFIKNIIIKKDGGFIIGSEAFYTSSRMNNWNRWDYLYGGGFGSSLDYYSYSPYYNSWYSRNRYSSAQPLRYHADNIVLLSFDKTGAMEWNSVIHKEQWNDESDDEVSYQVVNTGGQLHFLFNLEEKRAQLLNDYVMTPGGEVNRNPTLKNLDRNFEFMPRYGKQVSSRQMIVPCYYRNYICFAKIEYNS